MRGPLRSRSCSIHRRRLESVRREPGFDLRRSFALGLAELDERRTGLLRERARSCSFAWPRPRYAREVEPSLGQVRGRYLRGLPDLQRPRLRLDRVGEVTTLLVQAAEVAERGSDERMSRPEGVLVDRECPSQESECRVVLAE